MIFTNNINDLIKINTDSYLHNSKYSSTKLNKYYNAKFIGIDGKRVIINNKNQLDTGTGVLHRNLNDLNLIKDNIDIHNLKNKGVLYIDHLFIFTDDYGDRNICHWMTEQLLVLNYLIDILHILSNSSNPEQLFVVINKKPRDSMFNMIRDYLHKIPHLNHSNILEIDLNTGEIFSFDSINSVYVSNNAFSFEVSNLYIGNAINNKLTNLYSGWDELHSRLCLNSDNNSTYTHTNFSKNFYMSRRNLLKPNKRTNTRVMENLEEVSDIIVKKNYQEIFTDELENLDDRIDLFQNANTIICELGAGMHNLLYCNKGTTIYVLFQRNNYSWLQEYFPLFENKKMKVTLLVGETTNPEHNGNWLNTPWKLPILELDKIPIFS
jgi:hypothetical protein